MFRLLVFLCTMALVIGSAHAQIPEIRTFDLKVPDFDGTPNFGDMRIHDLHATTDEWVGGAEFGSGNVYHTGSKAQFIGCPEGGASLQSINQWRSIVGTCGHKGVMSGFFRTPSGVFTFLRPPGASLALANGHNNKEVVVGTWRNSDPNVSFLPFVWNRKTAGTVPANTLALRGYEAFALPIPGVAATIPHAINNHGKVVGIVTVNGQGIGWHGFVVQHPPTAASLVMIDVPGALETYPFDINDHGHVAGVYVNAQFQWIPFLWYNGQFYTLDIPNTIAADVTSITNDGRLAGAAITTEGLAQTFVTKGYLYTFFPWIPLTSTLSAVMARQAPGMMALHTEAHGGETMPDPTRSPLCQPTLFHPGKLQALRSMLCPQE